MANNNAVEYQTSSTLCYAIHYNGFIALFPTSDHITTPRSNPYDDYYRPLRLYNRGIPNNPLNHTA